MLKTTVDNEFEVTPTGWGEGEEWELAWAAPLRPLLSLWQWQWGHTRPEVWGSGCSEPRCRSGSGWGQRPGPCPDRRPRRADRWRQLWERQACCSSSWGCAAGGVWSSPPAPTADRETPPRRTWWRNTRKTHDKICCNIRSSKAFTQTNEIKSLEYICSEQPQSEITSLLEEEETHYIM